MTVPKVLPYYDLKKSLLVVPIIFFNSNKSERGSHLREGKKKKLTRTGRKTKPPPFKFKALNQYFVENSKRNLETSSDRPNDPEDCDEICRKI